MLRSWTLEVEEAPVVEVVEHIMLLKVDKKIMVLVHVTLAQSSDSAARVGTPGLDCWENETNSHTSVKKCATTPLQVFQLLLTSAILELIVHQNFLHHKRMYN